MKINIKTRTIEMPIEIVVDGIKYPITQWNVDVVRRYWKTKDEQVLKNLSDMFLDLG